MNTEQYNLILAGVEAWDEWREKNPDVRPDLQEADLLGAGLLGANLQRANLQGANLWMADLREADLYKANLQGANLWGANLYKANLQGANLMEADLMEADLRCVNLRHIKNTQGIFTFGPAGSRNDVTIYVAEYNQVRCGCWLGTFEEFAETVEDVHESSPVYLAQYRLGIEYFRGMKKIWEENHEAH